jgi:hypothetical protein
LRWPERRFSVGWGAAKLIERPPLHAQVRLEVNPFVNAIRAGGHSVESEVRVNGHRQIKIKSA